MELVNNFLLSIYNQSFVYISFLIVSSLVYYFVLRRHIYSIFDSFTVMLISNIISTSVVLFMEYNGMVSNYNFINYIITELALLLGIVTFKPIRFGHRYIEGREFKFVEKYVTEYFVTVFFIVASMFFIIVSILFYYKYGVPLFKSGSRLDIEKSSGIINVFITGSKLLLLILLVDNFINYKSNKKWYNIFNSLVAIFLIGTILVSGSRSSFISVIQVITIYFIFACKDKFNDRVWKKINIWLFAFTILAIISALIIISIRVNIDYKGVAEKPSVFKYLLIRLISYGDAYIYYYIPKITYTGGTVVNGLILVFSTIILPFKNLLSVFGINLFAEFPKPIGLIMYQTINNTDIIGGPNSRHNIFGLFYFGFIGSIVFSYVIGLAISASRNLLYKKLKYSKVNAVIYTILSYLSIMMIGDIALAMTYLKYIIIVLIILIIITIIVMNIINLIRNRVKALQQ